MKKQFMFILLLILSTVSVVSAQEDEVAYVRVAHFAADAPAVDLYFDGNISAVQDISYGDVTAWFTIPVGSYEVTVVPAGESADDAVIGPVTVEFEADGYYSLIAHGLVTTNSLDVIVIEEDYSDMIFGEFRLNVFHAIEGLEPVDILANGEPLFRLVALPNTITDEEGNLNDGFETLTLPEGTFDIQIVDNVDNTNVLLDVGEITFSQERNYLLAAVGTPVSPSIVLASTRTDTFEDDLVGDILTPANANATSGFVRVGHFSTGAPPVDIYIDGELTDIQSLEFPNVTDYVELPVGTYEVAIVPEDGDLEDALATTELTVGGDEYILVAAYGVLDNASFDALVIEEDNSSLAPGYFRLTVFHGQFGTGPVDVLRNDGLDPVRFLAYPGTTGDNDGHVSVDMVGGNYVFTVVSSDDNDTILAELPAIDYVPGRNYFLAIIQGANGYALSYIEELP
ncbi:MAG: DUF4397 domain-containing protein [Chloroflexi bacterium]|nr:MAG: DUF4397 domain-containing protein [Chloroflexota bacterium]